MIQTSNFHEVTKGRAKIFGRLARGPNFAPGEMAERSIAAVLKTVEGQTSGGSNPSLSAHKLESLQVLGFEGFFSSNIFSLNGKIQYNRLISIY